MLVEIPSFRWRRRSSTFKGGSTASNGYVCGDGIVSACLVVYSLDSSIGLHCFSIWKLQDSLDRLSFDRTKKTTWSTLRLDFPQHLCKAAVAIPAMFYCLIVKLFYSWTVELFWVWKIWILNNFRKKRQREERLRAAAEAESWSEIIISLFDFRLPLWQPCHYEWNILDFNSFFSQTLNPTRLSRKLNLVAYLIIARWWWWWMTTMVMLVVLLCHM